MAFSKLRPDFEARKVSLSIIYAMRTTFNIGFVCRPSKTQKSGLAPVEMTIVINGARTYLSLPRKEQPSTFKKLTESKKPNELKEYLQGVYNKVSQRPLRDLQSKVCQLSYKAYRYRQSNFSSFCTQYL
jgi:hypothetical protein